MPFIDTLPPYLQLIVWGLYLLMLIPAILIVVLEKSDPTRAMVWLLVLLLLPGVGLIVYFFFGRNLRVHLSYRRKQQVDISCILADEAVSVAHGTQVPEALAGKLHAARLILNSGGSPVLQGNQTTLYHEGESAFAQLLSDLGRATHSIWMEFYIVANDRTGGAIREVLIRKAKEGLDVRLIYDAVGSFGQFPKRILDGLRAAGVQCFVFHRVIFPYLSPRLNHRNHRKLVLIDGHIAHTGGMNIADRYVEGDPRLGPWRDTQMRITGPAVAALGGVFLNDWAFVTRKPVEPIQPQPAPVESSPASHPVLMQVASSGPDTDWAIIMQAFFLSIARAKRYVYITTPYFIPNESLLTALRAAALSGVNVKVLLPSRSDSRLAQWATYSYIGRLLEAGVQVYLFEGGFNHSKVLVVDGTLASVGSANMDIRSFEDNFELCTFIYDTRTCHDLEVEFLRNTLASRTPTLEQWQSRPRAVRLLMNLARLFSPLL